MENCELLQDFQKTLENNQDNQKYFKYPTQSCEFFRDFWRTSENQQLLQKPSNKFGKLFQKFLEDLVVASASSELFQMSFDNC